MDVYSQQTDMIPDNSQQGKVKHATLFLIFIASRYSLKVRMSEQHCEKNFL